MGLQCLSCMNGVRIYKAVSGLDGGGAHRRGNLVSLEDSWFGTRSLGQAQKSPAKETQALGGAQDLDVSLVRLEAGPAGDSATTSSGGVGARGQRGVRRAQPPPALRPARLLSAPRPLRDEIPGTSLVTIVTLRPSLSGLATEEGAANKKLWAVWGGPPHGVGGGQEVRGRGGAWATEARCLQRCLCLRPAMQGHFR